MTCYYIIIFYTCTRTYYYMDIFIRNVCRLENLCTTRRGYRDGQLGVCKEGIYVIYIRGAADWLHRSYTVSTTSVITRTIIY